MPSYSEDYKGQLTYDQGQPSYILGEQGHFPAIEEFLQPQFDTQMTHKTSQKPGELILNGSFLIEEKVSETASTAESSPRSIPDETHEAPSLENLRIGKTIGSGASCKVKVAKDSNGNEYAMKILKGNKRFKRFIQAEVETLSMIKHPNIVNLIEHGEGLEGDSMKSFQYILLELVNGGSLFDYVAQGGRFDEKFARHYFK